MTVFSPSLPPYSVHNTRVRCALATEPLSCAVFEAAPSNFPRGPPTAPVAPSASAPARNSRRSIGPAILSLRSVRKHFGRDERESEELCWIVTDAIQDTPALIAPAIDAEHVTNEIDTHWS